MKELDAIAEEVTQATALSSSSRWSEAAEAWRRVVELSMQAGELEQARAGVNERIEALRRDDRPGAMLVVLKQAQGLAEGPGKVRLDIQIIAALADAGQLKAAASTATELLSRTTHPGLRVVVADTLCGVLLSRGDVLGLSGLVERLSAEAQGPAAIAATFRRAQLNRLQGRLEDASDALMRVHQTLAPHRSAATAAGAALTEIADICLIKGENDEAFAFLHGAAGHFAEDGRRAATFQLEAQRAMAVLSSGAMTFLPGLLDNAVAYAEDRGLPLLEARCRLARGLCRAASGSEAAWGDLDAAVLLADHAGAPILAGRARLERFLAGWGPEGAEPQLEELRDAVEHLTGDRVWHTRAMTVLATRLAKRRPGEAIELAGRAVARFQGMGLDADEAQARAVLRVV
ncbi:MAG: hypothetical protein GY913_31070 [Proteobacteria bacterium]|nr:hypothetical protein [Pseudomonadota bacterium]MCP4921360.1 hypothetical protein [Pseudomonadota bacterium]